MQMNVWVVDEQHGETRDAERRREMQRGQTLLWLAIAQEGDDVLISG